MVQETSMLGMRSIIQLRDQNKAVIQCCQWLDSDKRRHRFTLPTQNHSIQDRFHLLAVPVLCIEPDAQVGLSCDLIKRLMWLKENMLRKTIETYLSFSLCESTPIWDLGMSEPLSARLLQLLTSSLWDISNQNSTRPKREECGWITKIQ